MVDTLHDIFSIEKDRKRFPTTKGWASDTFAPNKTGVVNCGFACHTTVRNEMSGVPHRFHV